MRHQLRSAAAGAILAATTLSACSSNNAIGPFGHPTSLNEQCIPLHGFKVATDGLEAVQNHSTTVAVIDKLALRKPIGLQLVRAWAVPSDGELFGAQDGYPPGHFKLPGWHWDRRQPANGAKVQHSTGKYDRMNLIVSARLAPGVTRGRTAGITIWYHVDSNHYVLKFETALVLIRGRSCPL